MLQPQKQVHMVVEENEESDESIYQLEEVGAVTHHQTKKFTTSLQIVEITGNTAVQCQLDTGPLAM